MVRVAAGAVAQQHQAVAQDVLLHQAVPVLVADRVDTGPVVREARAEPVVVVTAAVAHVLLVHLAQA